MTGDYAAGQRRPMATWEVEISAPIIVCFDLAVCRRSKIFPGEWFTYSHKCKRLITHRSPTGPKIKVALGLERTRRSVQPRFDQRGGTSGGTKMKTHRLFQKGSWDLIVKIKRS